MAKVRVFVDTNIILEAFRAGCWSPICERYAIETVEKCVEEALTGDLSQPRRIPVDRNALVSGLSGRHVVGKRELVDLVLAYPHCQALDDGELHLLAWLHANKLVPKALILLSTADKAAIVAAERLGWIDSLTSLEHLARTSGITPAQTGHLARHYREDWLGEIKMKIRLGILP
ncbi:MULTISPECIES: hypothetical protein [unclassified Cupriavidus]|uniref:hypothetical protein n=1 Tax=unclassified Cupriavidus TaxID=2640874 RepID=UPI000290DA12|nr:MULTISPECIES: hypothetical protein [unclassified Cupriavidus]ESJ14999.1 hypothetical protein B551_0213175 [Cupriavidus sp. HPC(L)]MCD9122452.1 hypothetical protein [Cupriavidus sp. UGS-1]